jgi:hypothetical protein
MVKPGISNPDHLVPIQVWSGLSTDYRAQAVRLMVQLALKFVATQVEERHKEGEHVKLNGQPQSTSRPS